MSVLSNQVAVTSAAGGTAIVPSAATANYIAGNDDGGPTRYVLIGNGTGATVYLGTSGVTTTTGLPLATSTTVGFWLAPDEVVYGIVASTGTTVSYLESGS